MSLDLEPIAKAALTGAAAIVTGLNPLAGLLVSWAGTTAFLIIDQQKAGNDPIAAAQLAGDQFAKLLEDIKYGTVPSP